MKQLDKTKFKIFFCSSFIFSFLLVLIIWVGNTWDYISDANNRDVLPVLETTEKWDEIDQIFQALEIIAHKWKQTEKVYSKEEYIFDWYILLGVFFISWWSTYFIFRKIISKFLLPFENNFEDLHNFIDNAGHELKTPLAVVDSGLWVMKEKKEFDIGLIQKLQSELLNANNLIEFLRELSNITTISKTEDLDVWVVLKEILLKYDKQILESKLEVHFNVIDNFSLQANRNYLDIFFSNIIGNAIKYNLEGGKINITVLWDKVVIEDSWIGISEEKIDKIFNRFYRVQNKRDKSWFGLWLSLVKKIADTYNWNIKVVSKEKQGTKFIIQF